MGTVKAMKERRPEHPLFAKQSLWQRSGRTLLRSSLAGVALGLFAVGVYAVIGQDEEVAVSSEPSKEPFVRVEEAARPVSLMSKEAYDAAPQEVRDVVDKAQQCVASIAEEATDPAEVQRRVSAECLLPARDAIERLQDE